MAGCTSLPDNSIPREIVEWSEANVWKVDTLGKSGSGFWINETQLITNCHVVYGAGNTVTVENYDRTLILPVSVKACDRDADMAILVYSEDMPVDVMPTAISEDIQKGQVIYGPGYPLGGSLLLSMGHYMGPDPRWGNRPIITADVIFGDSGSPALTLDWRGRVVVVGIRSGMRGFRNGYSTFFVTHIASIRDSTQMRKFLGENT